jgi:hypothetical protein
MTALRKEEQELKALLSDQTWRLNNLYHIKDKKGRDVKFKMNVAQRDLYENMHCYNVILKARQLGFSTFVMIFMLDECLFKRNKSCGVVAATKDDAEDLFKNKVKYAYDKLPEFLKAELTSTTDTARKIVFNNGSSISIGTSLRGGTYQILHVSEYGKISARYPEKAVEIKTGALNTVDVGQLIFVESTAEGNQGEFFEICEVARRLKESNAPLSPLDPKLFFYPWYQNTGYVLEEPYVSSTSIDVEMQAYFAKLGVDLTPEQKAWYVKKRDQQGDYMLREYPSTPAESFQQSMEGAYYTKQMTLVRERGQITSVPHDPHQKVYTFWDIGLNDEMVVWFLQFIGNKRRMIDYHESNNEGWDYYANMLQSKGYVYAEHIWPHDGSKRIQGREVQTSRSIAQGIGINPIRIVPRTSDVGQDIQNYCKPAITQTWFDETRCAEGLRHLDNYRKEWDERRSCWKDKPRHDQASHGADGFRTYAVGFDSMPVGHTAGYAPEHMPIDVEYDDDPYGL